MSLISAAKKLRDRVDQLRFVEPVTHVYNPLRYAWRTHEIYLRKYGGGPKRVVFFGMNPGPFGMAQTGVPFGQIAAVRDWLGITGTVDRPANEHPKRPVTGFDCHRSEVSGERLWGLFRKRFVTVDNFFQEHIVMNYCPLAFLEETGRNRTPDKLKPREREALFAICDEHLRDVVRILKPEWLIGIGDFAMKRALAARGAKTVPKLGQILHPSPACPESNIDWPGKVTKQLQALGVWN